MPEWKTTPKATKSPTITDIAWAAGFIEGEGCFNSPTRNYGRGPYTGSRLRVVQCNLEPLRKLKEIFGGKIRVMKVNPLSRRRIHFWAVNGARARGVALTVFTFLSARKRRQIRRIF